MGVGNGKWGEEFALSPFPFNYDFRQITHNKKSPPLPLSLSPSLPLSLSLSLFFRVIQPDMI